MECGRCKGTGFWSRSRGTRAHQAGDFCGHCDGVGFRDVPAASPCPELPSTNVKLAYLSARWRDGLPLFNPLDARDTG